MGLIHIELFATLNLVGQAPGGPGEDPVGFPFGGWQAPLMDEVAVPANITLLEPPVASPKSTVYLRCSLADGTPGTGDMSAPNRGAARDD